MPTQLSSTGWVATASSTAGSDVPANALDGVATTRWSTNGNQANGQWFQVDLQAAQTFNELTLDSGASAATFPIAYEVRVSNVDGSWAAAPAVATGAGESQAVTIKFKTQTARYVRITQTGARGTPWTIHELSAWLGTQECDTCSGDSCMVASCDPGARTPFPKEGLVSLFHLDGDSRSASESQENMIPGTVTTIHGVEGSALRFQGNSNSYLSGHAGWYNEISAGTGLTFVAWVRPEFACPGNGALFVRDWQFSVRLACTGTGTPGVQIGINTGNGPFYSYSYSAPAGSVPQNQWSQIAVTWDKANIKYYVNGQRVGADVPKTGTLIPGVPYTTMGYPNYIGGIDELAYYSRPLDAAAIAALYAPPSACKTVPSCADACNDGVCNAGQCTKMPKAVTTSCSDGNACTTGDHCSTGGQCVAGETATCGSLPSGGCSQLACDPQWSAFAAEDIVAQWHLDGNGTDASGKGFDLNVASTVQTVPGKVGQAMHIVSEVPSVACLERPSEVPHSFASFKAGITMAAWVKPDADFCQTYRVGMVMNRVNQFGLNLVCQYGQPNVRTQLAYDSPGTNAYAPYNQWSHLVATFDRPAGTIKIYLNGTLASTQTVAPNTDIPFNGSAGFELGCRSHLTIDEAIVLRRPVTAGEVATLYGTPTMCKTEPKANGLQCNDGNACTQTDKCQNGTCTGESPVTCSASDGCHAAGVCSPSTGLCSNPSLPGGSCQVGENHTWMYEPVAGKDSSQATGISSDGQIVGYSDMHTDPTWPDGQVAAPFVSVNDVTVHLPLPNGTSSAFGTAVSSTGHVIANAVASNGSKSVHLYRPENLGESQELPFSGGRASLARTTHPDYGPWPTVAGSAVGTAGAVWASYDVGAGPPSGSPSLYPHGEYQDGEVLGTNRNGDLVGYYAVADGTRTAMIRETSDGILRPLHYLVSSASGDWVPTAATGINDGGTVIGYERVDTVERPFKMNLGTGDVTDLTALWNEDFEMSGLALRPMAINAAGHIVGTAGVPTGQLGQHLEIQRAFVYTPLSGVQDLNNHFQMPENWVLASAVGLNDRDEVAGVAVNTVTGERRAYKAKILELPDVARLACVGKSEGDSCTPGRTCEANNVCHGGVCGGGAPADALCLSVDAVVDMGGGMLRAVFGYDSFSADTIIPSPNELTLGSAVVSFPQPPLPEWLPPGSHPRIFQQSLPNSQSLTWQVNGQKVSTSARPPIPKQTDEKGEYVTIGGIRLSLTPNIDEFAQVPDDPWPVTSVGEPTLGPQFNGVLAGTFGVGPTGAATYTLPISIPPGIAGMAPNLSLVYNSQGGNGIAGRGWELVGLSAIHRCPKERIHDGISRNVHNNSLDPAAVSEETKRDGLCIDGMHLFERAAGTYETESNDFSSITKVIPDQYAGTQNPPFSLKVVTKSGETRYYGSGPASTVSFPRELNGGVDEFMTPGIWALDRVMDVWGNYFDVEYNDGQKDFGSRGLIVTKISYTGHAPSGTIHCDDITGGCVDTTSAPSAPFTSVRFEYESRVDVRHVRFGNGSLRKASRLKKIATDNGQYALEYVPAPNLVGDALMLPSLLASIAYCTDPNGECSVAHCQTSSDCLQPLEFDWNGGGYGWDHAPSAANVGQENTYELPLPARLDTTFSGNDPSPRNNGTAFVDLNGDGRPDLVHSQVGTTPQVWENNGHGWTERADWTFPAYLAGTDGTRSQARMVDMDGDGMLDIVCCMSGGAHGPGFVYLNRIRQSGTWQTSVTYGTLPSSWSSANVDFRKEYFLSDMDADGRADLVWFGANTDILKVAINNGSGWSEPTLNYSWNFSGSHLVPNYHLEDINRDGLPDLKSDGVGLMYNRGANVGDFGSVWEAAAYPGAVYTFSPLPGHSQSGDIDGDGFLDMVESHRDGGPNYVLHKNVALGTGIGHTVNDTGGFLFSLASFATPNDNPNPNKRWDEEQFTLADLNADGLADYILNYPDGGQLLVSTGEKWLELNGATSRTTGWNATAGANRIPVVPGQGDGVAFIDLNGDGVTDLVQADGRAPTIPRRGSWLNMYRPPVITRFPNGLAKRSEVTYVVTSTTDAATVYTDTNTLSPNTKFTAPPIRVVASVSAEDGSGTGAMAETSYHYESLRESATGRGSQGFKAVVVTEPDNAVTATTYSQVYPFTGMPLGIVRSRNGIHRTTTANVYCAKSTTETSPTCGSEGAAPSIEYPPRTTVFVYPKTVVDKSYLSGRAAGSEIVTTTTSFEYDDRGNATTTSVQTEDDLTGEKYLKKTENEYGASGSDEQKMGKVKKTTVTSQRLQPAGTPSVHVTAFQYTPINNHQVGANGETHNTIALTKKIVEPGRAATEHPYSPYVENAFELHTVYGYDRYGNVTATTSCANDFDDCSAGASGPSGTDPDHLPFRTMRVSYEPTDFVAPSPTLPVQALSYLEKGRFPVKATNAQGHEEYSAYDWKKGALVQKTAADGISTCFSYDAFGRQVSEVAQCGSGSPRATETHQYESTMADPWGTKVVSVTRAATGQTTWVYANSVGQTIETRGRSFEGGFIQTQTTYDTLGRVVTTSKPRKMGGDPVFVTSPHYDDLGRVDAVTQELGTVDASQGPKSAVTQTIFEGSSITTEDTVGGVAHQHRRVETKNAMGKVSSVEDANGKVITYSYDGDGNLTETEDSDHVKVKLQYDRNGRKRITHDPDLGSWQYYYNAFGDLVAQVDANGQATVMAYDRIGRMTSKTDASGQAEWLYDVGSGRGVGRLAAEVSAPDGRLNGTCSVPYNVASDGNRAARWFTYTTNGEIQQAFECADGETFATTFTYDQLGRTASVTYPQIGSEQLVIGYNYTKLGFLQSVTDAPSSALWVAKEIDAAGSVAAEYTRNGVETVSTRNLSTGWLLSSNSVAHGDDDRKVQGWSYSYDEAGNLKARTRQDDVTPRRSEETFQYDGLDRVLSSLVSLPASGQLQPYSATQSTAYLDNGNIQTKNGLAYTYAGCGGRPHAVCSVNGESSYSYDLNGNMVSGAGRTIDYGPANKPVNISRGSDSVAFIYGADGNRVVQDVSHSLSSVARTIYVGLGGTGKSLYERTTRRDAPGNADVVEHSQFIYAGTAHGGNALALRSTNQRGASTVATTTRYYHFDRLGSVTAVSDAQGRVVSEEWGGPNADVIGYDTWGARRHADARSADPGSFRLQAGHREYTGHETIPDVGLVNMNGRVYDPQLGRFLSPDPHVQFVANLQSYNRYSYVLNNPLRYTDPTGYFSSDGFTKGMLAAIPIAIAVVGAIACPATAGGGCLVAFAAVAALEATAIAKASGASDGQAFAAGIVVLGTGMVGAAGSAVAATTPLQAMVVGTMSGAVSGAFSGIVNGDLGTSILKGALQGALAAGVGLCIKAALSEASAAEAQGGGTDAGLTRGGEARERAGQVRLAKDRAMADGQVLRRRVGDIPVEVYGLTASERESAFNALKADLSADCDASRSIVRALGNRRDGAGVRAMEVILVKSPNGEIGSFSVPGSNQIVVDRWNVGDIYDSRAPGGKYTYGRILAHELGHAALGLSDDGPTFMNNVNTVENPIMRTLKDNNDRMSY